MINEDFFIYEQLSHKKNLEQKGKNAFDEETEELVRQAKSGYHAFIEGINYDEVTKLDLNSSVAALEDYISIAKEIEKKHKMFNWRSDYAGSIIPEFLYRIVHVATVKAGLKPIFSTRNTIIEISGAAHREGLQIRRKNEDFALGFHEVDVKIASESHRVISLAVACEVKTNIDKNKLNGLDFSAERMKRTYPGSAYFLITETLDFSPDENHSSGLIDEIYVLRKQVRTKNRVQKAPLCPSVFAELLEDILEISYRASNVKGHVYDRLEGGKLIRV
uniref:BbvCI endonuclease subunit 1 n=1 Tax=Brevibacillus brevis TaxID=1393 RepID=Q5D6Y5_BREBE|nr:BbvCI endonuclease subunit 1 [Brevibacillus brevis]AAY87146.1 BbvCI restriction endonuclease subunit 1 [synthetic construct]6MAF_A Chain A, BbvCI endonuclease subunit 1 [Brevibacillus brevis]6MAF_B Chain B, BbvCI endonuclease subunit 1 [Brevibacillus brevis]